MLWKCTFKVCQLKPQKKNQKKLNKSLVIVFSQSLFTMGNVTKYRKSCRLLKNLCVNKDCKFRLFDLDVQVLSPFSVSCTLKQTVLTSICLTCVSGTQIKVLKCFIYYYYYCHCRIVFFFVLLWVFFLHVAVAQS